MKEKNCRVTTPQCKKFYSVPGSAWDGSEPEALPSFRIQAELGCKEPNASRGERPCAPTFQGNDRVFTIVRRR